MYCSYCGQIIDENTVFCDKCGRKVDEGSSGEGTNTGTVFLSERISPESVSSMKQLTYPKQINANQSYNATKPAPQNKKIKVFWIPLLIVAVTLFSIKACNVQEREKKDKAFAERWEKNHSQEEEDVNDVVKEIYEITDVDVTDQLTESVFKAAYNSVEEEFYDAASIAKLHYEYLLFPDVNISAFFTTIRGRITDEITPTRFIVGNSRDGTSNKIYVLYSIPYEVYILDYPDDETRNGEVIGAGTTYIATEINDTKIIGDDYSLGSIYDPKLYKDMQAFESMIDQQKGIYDFKEYDFR